MGQSYAPSYNAVQINLDKPTANIGQQPVIYDYPQADGQIYYPPIQTKPVNFGQNTTVTKTPSGVGNYENYKEVDTNGNEVTSVEYFDNGTEITQVMKIKSYDGTTIDKVTTNGNGVNKMTLTITDENGNVLLDKNKSYGKYGNDMALTVVNGEEYKTTGLSGDIINIEHNGQVTTIDLNKLVSKNVCTLLGEEGRTNAWGVGNNDLTKEQEAKLKSQIKNLSADDLIRLTKAVEVLHVLESKEGYESFYDGENGEKALLLGPSIESSTTLHELGHAINHINESNVKSDNGNLAKIKEHEEQNFLKRINKNEPSDFFCHEKFIDIKNLSAQTDMSKEEVIAHLRDEVFAESYSVLNNTTIMTENEQFMATRTLGLMKAFPKTMVEVDQLSNV